MSNRKVVLYISMSLDGFIATKDDDLSWLSIVQQGTEDYGYEAFNNTVDTYIVGRQTYEVILKLCNGVFPQAEKLKCYVITRQDRASENGVEFYNGDIKTLIDKLKSEKGKNIYCDGGGQIVKLLMEKNLIDEYIVSVIPTILGEGKRLFVGGIDALNIKHIATESFDSGLVQLKYIKQ